MAKSTEKTEKEVAQTEPVLQTFYFPSLQRSIQAASLEEATKIVEGLENQ